MKRATLLITTGLLAVGTALADVATVETYKQLLSKAKTVELPAIVASWVSGAPAYERAAVTTRSLQASAGVSAGSLPSVVASVSKAVPDMAATAARAAATERPQLVLWFAKAAAAAAPSRAGQIGVTLCQAQPEHFKRVLVAVGEGAPKATKEILIAAAAAFPDLKGDIEKGMAAHNGNPPSVGAVVNSMSRAPAGTRPEGTTPGEGRYPAPPRGHITPNWPDDLPHGRDYARP